MKLFAFWLTLLIALTSCTHWNTKNKRQKRVRAAVSSNQMNQSGGNLTQCIDLDQEQIPFYEPNSQLFFTKAMNECSSEDRIGISSGSKWTAMGLPCSGSTGKLDWRGSLARPKMIMFDFGAYCPIIPAIPKADFPTAFGITPKERLVAVLPMMVQFWKVLSTRDKGMGQKVELRSFQALNLFKRMKQKGEAMNLELFGRESSWKPNKNLYKYTVEVNSSGGGTFRVKILDANLMTQSEKQDLLKDCQELKPARPCQMMFPKARKSN